MANVTAGDMLDRAQDFERRLEALYADLRDRVTNDGARLLVYYLARHLRHLPEALETVPPADLTEIRAAPIKYDDTDFDPARRFATLGCDSAITGRELLDHAISLVEELIRFYRWVAAQPLGEKPHDLFDTLRRIEERHVVELKKIRAMDYF